MEFESALVEFVELFKDDPSILDKFQEFVTSSVSIPAPTPSPPETLIVSPSPQPSSSSKKKKSKAKASHPVAESPKPVLNELVPQASNDRAGRDRSRLAASASSRRSHSSVLHPELTSGSEEQQFLAASWMDLADSTSGTGDFSVVNCSTPVTLEASPSSVPPSTGKSKPTRPPSEFILRDASLWHRVRPVLEEMDAGYHSRSHRLGIQVHLTNPDAYHQVTRRLLSDRIPIHAYPLEDKKVLRGVPEEFVPAPAFAPESDGCGWSSVYIMNLFDVIDFDELKIIKSKYPEGDLNQAYYEHRQFFDRLSAVPVPPGCKPEYFGPPHLRPPSAR